MASEARDRLSADIGHHELGYDLYGTLSIARDDVACRTRQMTPQRLVLGDVRQSEMSGLATLSLYLDRPKKQPGAIVLTHRRGRRKR